MVSAGLSGGLGWPLDSWSCCFSEGEIIIWILMTIVGLACHWPGCPSARSIQDADDDGDNNGDDAIDDDGHDDGGDDDGDDSGGSGSCAAASAAAALTASTASAASSESNHYFESIVINALWVKSGNRANLKCLKVNNDFALIFHRKFFISFLIDAELPKVYD